MQNASLLFFMQGKRTFLMNKDEKSQPHLELFIGGKGGFSDVLECVKLSTLRRVVGRSYR